MNDRTNPRRRRPRARLPLCLALLALLAPPAAASPPNVLWVVWDTVRADRLSLYGHERPTTPKLARWARDARVFEDCLSTASSTVPSHASMFTGLLPGEHGTHHSQRRLDPAHTTLAERLRERGYQTYLFSANPHVSADLGFDQGFDLAEHPWQPAYREEAVRIVRAKVPPQDRSSEIAERVRAAPASSLSDWSIKASGAIARRALESWLEKRDPARPWFAFLNYMEAHRPFVPSPEHRRRMMSEEQVARSYAIDRSWFAIWAYVFGFRDYTRDELEVMAATYDATLAELDDLFAELVASLGSKGLLDDTVVVLTSDHGEHLGEHHLLDHQYSLYNPLIRVPLVVWYPARVPAGREPRPVASFDLFPTLLELAGADGAAAPRHARSLLDPDPARVRLAEYPSPMKGPIATVRPAHPSLDVARFSRTLRALVDGPWKYIRWSDGDEALYDYARDPAETRNLNREQREVARRLAARLDATVASFEPWRSTPEADAVLSEEQRARLRALGYLEEPGSEASPP